MESYTNLDLHLQFVSFFHNKHLYMDGSNDEKNILPTSRLLGDLSCEILSLTLTIFNVFFPSVNFNKSKVTEKIITGTYVAVFTTPFEWTN